MDGKIPPSYCGCGLHRSLFARATPKAEFVTGKKIQCAGVSDESETLAFRELEPFARALLAVLLPFVASRVAGQQSGLLQLRTQLGIELDQRASDPQPGSACLADGAAAIRENQDVKLLRHFRGEQRLTHNGARRFIDKIMFEGPAVYRDLALARTEKNPRDGFLPAACS